MIMPWCNTCGKRNPPEQDYIFESYDGDYFCSDECREVQKNRYDFE